MCPVVGGSVDAAGDTFDQQDDGAVEAGCVAGDCDGDDDGADWP
jgi:hypothetical protein